MTNTIFQFSIGSLSAAGFASNAEKDGKTTTWHNVVFSRSYFDATENKYKRSSYFALRDLFTLRRLVDAAIDRVLLLDGRVNADLRAALGEKTTQAMDASNGALEEQPPVAKAEDIPF